LNQKDKICTDSHKYVSILHLDRLQITLKHLDSSIFKNHYNPDTFPAEQSFGRIRLLLDNSKGASAYHHTFIVFFDGQKVGKLHAGNKLHKPDLEFDFDKEILYAVDETWWYNVYESVKDELGVVFNNINYVEIALDTTKNLVEDFRLKYTNTEENKSSVNCFFRMNRGAVVDVLDNGHTFNIRGTCNNISIYTKTSHAESYILDFFKLNGFGDTDVYRLEARLNWNYLKTKMNYKKVLVNVETLLDKRLLATLFKISTENKLIFSDLRTKYYDNNRNIKFEKTSVIDDVQIETAELLKYNPELKNNHYKADNVDENILRQTFYMYVQTGNKQYLYNIKHCAEAASMNYAYVHNLLQNFACKYRGNQTKESQQRMDKAIMYYKKRKNAGILTKLLNKLVLRVQKNLLAPWST
jgi:hypothetical protein